MKLSSALYDCHYPFDKLKMFDDYNIVIKPDDLEKDSCLVVWGGGDISPSMYNRKVSSRTQAGVKFSSRDWAEWQLMQRAQQMSLPIIGICRGAQMLCALAGGYLIQDVTNHTSSHHVKTHDGYTFKVSSLHHQMLCPFEVDHVLVAWSKHALSDYYMDEDTLVSMSLEPEFVYFPKQKGIAIQWHPEFMHEDCPANLYTASKIKEFLS